MGSYLRNGDDELIWHQGLRACFHLDREDSYLTSLQLNREGDSIADIRVDRIFDGSRAYFTNHYGGLIEFLKSAGYQQDRTLFVFPYDWRMDNGKNATKLQQFIEMTVLPKSGQTKVDVVAHSMGGLIVRKYATLPALLNHPGSEGATRLNNVIYLGTPHEGSPEAFGPLAFDDSLAERFMQVPCINTNTLANLSRSFPSVFELLPRKPFIYSDSKHLLLSLDESYLSPPNGLGFLKSSYWVKEAGSFHASLDRTIPAKQFSIVGTGISTLTKLELYEDSQRRRRTWCAVGGNGDETVPIESAGSVSSAQTYYTNEIEHKNLPNNSTIQRLVLRILRNETGQPPEGVKEQPFATPGVIEWCADSPIRLSIKDDAGKTNGVTADGILHSDISKTSFFIFEDNQSGFLLPKEKYHIQIHAVAAGTFSLRFLLKSPEGERREAFIFYDIPISTRSTGQLDISPEEQNLFLQLDIDGEGNSDLKLPANQKPTVLSLMAIFKSELRTKSLDYETVSPILQSLDQIAHASSSEEAKKDLIHIQQEIDRLWSKQQLTPARAEALQVIADAMRQQLDKTSK